MSRTKQIAGMLLILSMVLLVACAPKAVPAPAPAPAPGPGPTAESRVAPPQAAQTLAPAKVPWEAMWDNTVMRARQEGIIVLSTAIGGDPRQLIVGPFQRKYGVRIETMIANAAQNAARIAAEQRAGIYSYDLWLSGSAVSSPVMDKIDRLEPLFILPELTEPELIKKTWFFGVLSWIDKNHTLLRSGISYKQSITINTNAVKADEIKTYRDLLSPKWKGKTSVNDPRITGAGLVWFSSALEMGDVDINYIRELVTKQEVLVTRDSQLQVDWLAKGKHAIAINPTSAAVIAFMQAGAPVNRINVGTPSANSGTSSIAVLKRAPHPNAARLYVNWLLSQEGQTFLSRAADVQSERLDVPTGHLDPEIVLKPGTKVFWIDDEEFLKKKDTYYVQLAKELLGP